VGDGPGRGRLAARAGGSVEFTGRVSDAELAELYAGCRALVFPSEEDFGIVPLEAQAAGRPVIAFGAGGARETVIGWSEAEPGPTGLFFFKQTPEALAAAVRRFDTLEPEFDPLRIRAHAERYEPARFREQIAEQVELTRAMDVPARHDPE